MKQTLLFGKKPLSLSTPQPSTPKRKRDENSTSETKPSVIDVMEEEQFNSNSPVKKKLKMNELFSPTPLQSLVNDEQIPSSTSSSSSSTSTNDKLIDLNEQIKSKLEFLKNGKNYSTDLMNDDTTKIELQALHDAVHQNKTDIFASDKQFPDVFVPLLCKLIQDSSKTEDDLVTFIFDTCFSTVPSTLQVPSKETLKQQVILIAKRENYGLEGDDESLHFWIWEVKNISNIPKKIKSMLKDRRTERKECKRQIKQLTSEKQKLEKLKTKEEREKEKDEKRKEKEEKKKEKEKDEEKKKQEESQQKEEEKKKKPSGLDISKFLKVKNESKKPIDNFSTLPFMQLTDVENEESIFSSIESQSKSSSSSHELLRDIISVCKSRQMIAKNEPSSRKRQFRQFCKEKLILDPAIKCFKFELYPLHIGTKSICSTLLGKVNSKGQYLRLLKKLSRNPFQKAYLDDAMDNYYDNMCCDEEYAEGEEVAESLDGEEEKDELLFDEEDDDGFLVAEGYLSDEEMQDSDGDEEEENRVSTSLKKKEDLSWNPIVVGPVVSLAQLSSCNLQSKSILELLRSHSMTQNAFQVSFDDDKVSLPTQSADATSSSNIGQDKKKRYMEIDHNAWKQFIETEDLKTMVKLVHGSSLSKDTILSEVCQHAKNSKVCNRAAAKRQLENISLKEKREGDSTKLYYVNNEVLSFLQLDASAILEESKRRNEEEKKKQQEEKKQQETASTSNNLQPVSHLL